MKILIGMTRSDTIVSGSFSHIRQIGEEFRHQGAEVVYVLGGEGSALTMLNDLGFRTYSLPKLYRNLHIFWDLLVLFQLIWIILKERPAICSWHTAKIGALGRIAVLSTCCRSYYIPHGVPFVNTPENQGYKIYERLERLLAVLPTRIICVCNFDFSEYRRIGVAASKLITIHNGMPNHRINAREAKANDRIRFITAARFEAQKDYVSLASACKKLNDMGKDFELHIFGDGSHEDAVREKFMGILEGKVIFRGVVDDFSQQLVNADVFVLSSHWEGLPRSIIEAMACKKAVIASDVGGVSELVQNEKNGYLVKAHDVEALTLAMLHYINKPEKVEAHGVAGFHQYEKQFTLNKMLSKYRKEYLKV